MPSFNLTSQRVQLTLGPTGSVAIPCAVYVVTVACCVAGIKRARQFVDPHRAFAQRHLAYIDLIHGLVACALTLYPAFMEQVSSWNLQCVPLDGSFLQFVVSLWAVSCAICITRYFCGQHLYFRTKSNRAPSSFRASLSFSGSVLLIVAFVLLYATPFTVPLPRMPFASQRNYIKLAVCLPTWSGAAPAYLVYLFGLSIMPTFATITSHLISKHFKSDKYVLLYNREYEDGLGWLLPWNSFALSSFPWIFTCVLLAKTQPLHYWVTLVLASLVSFHSFWNLLIFSAFHEDEEQDQKDNYEYDTQTSKDIYKKQIL